MSVVKKQRPVGTDMELITSAVNGDMQSFEALYDRFSGRVYSVCVRMMHDTHDAQDMTQDVFVHLFRKLPQFRGDSSFNTWLHRLTVNQVLMHFRKRSVKVEKVTLDGNVPEKAVRGSENIHKMSIDHQIDLANAIEQLPQGYRSVFELHDIHGFEHVEVAEILGCSVGTSKSQLHKARLKMRELLNKKRFPKLFMISNIERTA